MSRCRAYRASIVASLEGELAPADALRLARHLDRCTACRIRMAREARLATMLGDLDDPVDVDERFFHGVMASLPERAPQAGSVRARWRRGLKLAGTAGIVAVGAGLLTRIVPSLRFDVAAPAIPRFSPEETEGWLSLVGSAAQWVRVTAQSLAWAGTPGGLSARTLGILSLETALLAAATFLAVSGALVVASRARSRVS